MLMDFLLNQMEEIEMKRRVSFSILPIEIKREINSFPSTTTNKQQE